MDGPRLAFPVYDLYWLQLELLCEVATRYRYQHMSNAGIATPNPGLNLHMVAFSYLF